MTYRMLGINQHQSGFVFFGKEAALLLIEIT
jgi:hypothetical protein